MSLTATRSSSASASSAGRKRLGPILPKPLIPPLTGAIWRTLLDLDLQVARNRDFHAVPIGVPQISSVVTRTVSGSGSGRSVVDPAGPQAALPCRLYGRDRVGRE